MRGQIFTSLDTSIRPVSAFRVRGLVRMYQHRSCFSHRCTGPLG